MTHHGTAPTMSLGQFREFAGTILRCLPGDLDPSTAQEWIDDPETLREALRKVLNASLLKEIGTVAVPAIDRQFVVSEHFVSGDNPKIVLVGKQFKDWFWGKVEEPAAEAKLFCAELTRPALDTSILKALGEKAETTLAQVWALMKRQPNGEEGVLLANGRPNSFCIDGRTVHIRWYGDGWHVDASLSKDPYRWYDEYRVFSRA